jgi:acyl-CoA dehydrogenase
MDFTLSPAVEKTRSAVRDFVDRELIPLEAHDINWGDGENVRLDLLQKLRAKAKKAKLWSLQMPKSMGGGGLDTVGMAACYEEMGRALFGPVVFNSAAPDDGNMMILGKVATAAQRRKWLAPIVEGKVRSSFAMTEPDPGAGSDPGMMLTTATKKRGKWTVKGRKWFITGAGEARHFILIARTSDDARKGLSAFMFHADQPGWRIVRRIPILGPEEHGGHCEIEFDGLEIDDADRLMEVGDGLKLTQIRLGTARLTHCMRWLGMARRAMEIALPYVEARKSFGKKLIDREGVQWLLGEAAMQIEIGRLLTMRAAWKLDQGDFARKEVSMAKVAVADVLHKAVDTAIQLLGARGYSRDVPLEWMYRYARQARLVDGASEVHKMVLARFLAQERTEFWAWR